MSAERVVYLDSSAIVKLVVREPESAGLRRYLRRHRNLISSALARTEVARALLPLGPAAQERGGKVLRSIELVRLSDRVLAQAGTLLPPDLGSLDAIHIATAALLGASLTRFLTYDSRLASAARLQGWPVVSPG